VNVHSNVQRRRLKYAATINNEALGEETDADYELQYVDIGNVDSSGTIHEIATYRFADAPSRARRRVRDGDVIISCVRTYLQAISPIRDPPDNLIVSTGFAVVRPRGGVLDAAFGKYALRESAFLAEVEMRSVGVSYPAINASDIGDITVSLPSVQSQRTIADYLDRETARLDALVAAKERALGLLAEKRRALITRAVTRGLDPRAPLRDSGIRWLGEIPAYWELKRAKWLFWERDQRSTTGEEVLLSLRMERGLVPHNDVSVKQTQPEELVGYKQVSTGEIVVNRMRAASGLVAIAPQDGLVSPDYAVFRVSRSANAEYFTHLFKTELMQAVFRSESTGLGTGSSGFLRLYSESFLSLWLPYPPTNEQAAILAHIEKALAKLDAILAATERTVTLLKERRAALIAAAVTGQIVVESAV
jgi:type I restriction enzyme, S subunit